jgi:hypothetical protein
VKGPAGEGSGHGEEEENFGDGGIAAPGFDEGFEKEGAADETANDCADEGKDHRAGGSESFGDALEGPAYHKGGDERVAKSDEHRNEDKQGESVLADAVEANHRGGAQGGREAGR